MGGVYANFANVSHSDYEFTVTFARVDHEVESDEVPGVVVSRVNLSPRFMRELIDAMEDNYSKWRTREGIKNLPEYGGRRAVPPRTRAPRPRLRCPAARLQPRTAWNARRSRCSYPARMKVAVISDIHGNRHAFEATLEAIAASDAAELWCLGDLVGYGAEPDACVELARAARGGVPGRQPRPRRHRRDPARRVLPRREPGRAVDARGDRAREPRLPAKACARRARRGRVGLYHASPRDPVWEYVLSALLAELCLDVASDTASA